MPDSPEWTIHPYREEDADRVVELLASCLGRGGIPRSTAFWRWKHESNPFGPSPALVATAGRELVALRAFLRWDWWSGERRVPAVRAVDTATRADHRGRGLFSALTGELVERETERGTAFVFNTPNRQSGPGYLKMGWRRLGRLPVLVRPFALRSLARRMGLGGAPASALEPGLEPMARFLDRPQTAPLLAAVEGERGADPRHRSRLDDAYLRWRYAAIPGLDYQAAWHGEGDAAAALVVRTRRRRGLVEASVSEILVTAAPASVRNAARLLRALGSTTSAGYAVAVASPRTAERRALGRAGFLPLPGAGPHLYARRLAGQPPRLADWRLSVGSFEIF
ncbi:MAG TPA: GNAT family N-acetyltransferase [Thermoanaerobaculia bacterium]|nr:GNAT family N-acetyltransferase [Thermoanaerobaculia bacterium]